MELPNHSLWTAREKHDTRKQFSLPFQIAGGSVAIVGMIFLTFGTADKTVVQLIVAGVAVIGGGLLLVGGTKMLEPVRWLCPKCHCRIHANEPWRCGFCKTEHPQTGKKPKTSFLEHCSNSNCGGKPTAFECPECWTVMFLTRELVGRRHATSLNACLSPAPQLPTNEEIQLLRARELGEKEHSLRHLEADRELFKLEIENAKLRKELNRPEPQVVTPRQARINWVADALEAARHKCHTMEQVAQEEPLLLARIDRLDCDPEEKTRMKDAIRSHFDDMRIKVGMPDSGLAGH